MFFGSKKYGNLSVEDIHTIKTAVARSGPRVTYQEVYNAPHQEQAALLARFERPTLAEWLVSEDKAGYRTCVVPARDSDKGNWRCPGGAGVEEIKMSDAKAWLRSVGVGPKAQIQYLHVELG